MSELSSALTQYLRSLDDSESRAAFEAALGDIDVVAARAESKKNPASLDAAASLLGRLILDGEDAAEVIKAAKLIAQRAPRNNDGNEVALLAGTVVWKVGGETKIAEPYFRRVRRKNPASAALLEFYREVYNEPKDASQLMQVLVSARRAVKDDPARRFALAEEMASLAEEKLGSVDRAIEVWRSVLREDGYDERAAQALMRLYRAGEKWTALVELLKDEFERIDDTPENREDRIGRLLEIAELYRDQLNLDAMALSTLQRILDIDPRHDGSLKALAETYGNAGRWNDLLAVYNRLVDAARNDNDEPRQIDMLLRIARIHLDELRDPKQGLVPLEEVLKIDPKQKQARGLIAQAYELRGDWDALVELYREQLKGSDEQEACEIRCKVARLYQERFKDEEQAIVAWNAVLEFHGDVDEALAALANLYEGSSRWAEAAEVLHRQIHGTPDTNRAIELLTHLAALYLDRLDDRPQSLRMWEEVARLAPGHAQAVSILQDAYIADARWQDLERMYERMERLVDVLDILMSAAATIELAEERVKVYLQVSSICREKLSDASRGTEALEKILELEPDNQDVAHRLLPIYHAENRWDRLISTLEGMLAHAGNDDDRLDLIARIRDVASQKLNDPALAMAWAGRAYTLRPDDEVLRAGLESAAERSNDWGKLTELFEERLGSDDCGETERLELLDKLAEIARDRQGDLDRAQVYLQRIIELDPTNESALTSLEDIYSITDNWVMLAGIYGRRLEHAGGYTTRVMLLRQLARINEEKLGELDAAVERYEEVLELIPGDAEALDSLSRLHRNRQAWSSLTDVLERRLQLLDDTGDQVSLLFERSKVFAERLHDSQKALDGFLKVLEIEPDHLPTIDALEHLRRADPSVALTIMRSLLPYYRSIQDRVREAQAMEVIAAHEADLGVRRLQLNELLTIYSRLGGREVDMLRVRMLLFETDPPDTEVRAGIRQQAAELESLEILASTYESALKHIAERINKAELAGRKPAEVDINLRRELRLELAELLRDSLDRPEAAEKVYQAILNVEETHQDAFECLDELLRARSAHEDLVKLYRRRVDAIFEPTQQRDLLNKIIKLARYALDDNTMATRTAEELLDLEPDDLATIELLAGMYEDSASSEDHYALEELLGRWSELVEDETTRNQIACRRAGLRKNKLGDAFGAIELLAPIVDGNPSHTQALNLLEELLAVEDVQLQVATLLEPIYVELGDHEARVRVLRVRRTQAERLGSIDEATSFLIQIAQIEETQLGRPEEAFEALCEAYLVDPRRLDTRTEVQRLGLELGKLRDLVDVWRAAIDKVNDRLIKIDLLSRTATLLDDHLEDIDGARAAYSELFELDPPDTALAKKVASALVRLHRAAEDPAALVEALRALSRHTVDIDEQVKIALETAQILEIQLEDQSGAAAAYYEVLDLDPENFTALDALERLFVALEDWDQLCDVLRQRIEVVEDDAEKARLWRKVGEVQRDHALNPHAAIEAFQWIIDLDVGEAYTVAALSAMVGINSEREQWGDVEEGLRRLTDLAQSSEEQANLMVRTAEVVSDKLGRYQDAVEILVQVLGLDPMHEQARRQLVALLDYDQTRERVIEILRPLYEAEQNWEALLDLEERRASHLPAGSERIAALMRVAQTHEHRLGDPQRAFQVMCQLMASAGDQPDLPQVVAEVERLGAAPERAEELLKAYRDAVDNILDSEVMLHVLRNMGGVALGRLERLEEARQAYERVLELAPTDGRALDALELIYVSESDDEALADLLCRRAETADDDNKRDEYWIRAAEIFAGQLGRPEDAVDLYERLSPEAQSRPRVRNALEPLYEQTERFLDLATFFERKLEENLDLDEQVNLRLRLSELYALKLENSEDGLRHFAEGLRLDPERAIAQGDLDRYLGDENLRRQVVERLVPVFTEIADWQRLIQIHELRLEGADSPDDRVELLTEIATILETQVEDLERAYTTYKRVFKAKPEHLKGRGQLSRLAAVLGTTEDFANLLTEYVSHDAPDDNREEILEIVREAADLWAVHLDNPRAGVPLLQRLLSARPEDTAVFASLEAAMKQAEMWHELANAYWHEADTSYDETHQVSVLLRLAELASTVLVDDDMLARAFRRVLELEPNHARARIELEALLERNEQWDGLVELLRDRQQQTESAGEREEVQLRIAEIQNSHLAQPDAAIDTLETVFLDHPASPGAVDALERIAEQREEQRPRVFAILRPIYEETQNHQRIVDVDEWQLTVTEDPIRRHELYREMASLMEASGGDGPLYAFQTLIRGLSEPGPDEVLEALDSEVRRLVKHLGAFEVLTSAMINAAEAEALTDEPKRRVSLLMQAAELQLGSGDNNLAVQLLQQSLVIIEDHRGALTMLDESLIRVGRYEELRSVLERRIAICEDERDREELLRRLARLLEDTLMLGDEAVSAWRRLLEIEPNDTEALTRLRKAYQASGATEELIDVMDRQVENAEQPDDRRRLRMELARIHRDAANDRAAEIDVLQALLAEDPSDDEGMSQLADALVAEERFSEAAGVMLDRAGSAELSAQRAEILLAVARLYVGPIGDVVGSLAHYEGVLQVDDGQEGAITDLVELAEKPEHSESAATLVLPYLDRRGRYKELDRVLDARARLADDPVEKAEALRRLVRVRFERLHDPAASLDAANRLIEVVSVDELQPVLEQAARLSVHLGQAEAHIDALAQRSQNPDREPQARVLMAMSAADLAEEIMGDKARALTLLAPLVEHELADLNLCRGVERLARSLGDKKMLALALRESARLSLGESGQADILVRLGDAEMAAGNVIESTKAYREALDAHAGFAGAVAGLERILDAAQSNSEPPAREVLDALERAYQDAGNKPGLARLAKIRLENAEGDELLIQLDNLGRLLDDGGGRPREALEVWGNLLMRDAESENALRRVVELSEERALLSDAIHFMAAAIDAARDGQRPCLNLCVETTKILLSKIGDSRTALRALAPALAENPEHREALKLQVIASRAAGDAEALHDALVRLARGADAPDEAITLWREASEVAEHQQNADRMREDLEQLLELDEGDETAWHKWLEVLASLGRYEELADGLGRRSMITSNDEERHILRHHLARLLVEPLDRVDDAINTYHDMLGAKPDDAVALGELEELLKRYERWSDVRDVLERKAELITGDDRVAVLEELAQLVAGPLEDPTAAIEIHHRILSESPGHSHSFEALEGLLGQAEQWYELSELIDNRLRQLVDAAGESEAAATEYQARTLQLAELYAKRLGEAERARELLTTALANEPENVAVLLSMARVQDLTGDTEAMEETLHRAAALDPQGELGAELQVRLARLADAPERRREHLEAALHLHPSHLEAAQALLDLSREEEYWEQVAYLLALVSSFEEDPEKRRKLDLERADMLVNRLGELDQALEVLAPIYEEVQDDPAVNRRIADALFASQRYEEAAGMYEWLAEVTEGASKRDKTLGHYLTRLARIDLDREEPNLEESLDKLKKAYRIDTTNAETLVVLADLHASQNNWKDALKLSRAMLLQNVDQSGMLRRGDIYIRLANAHIALDENNKAKSMLRRGKQEDPEHPEISAMLEQLN